jgi:tRNA A-37 threonylcarbamoyl transferase component Bud32
MPRPRPPLWLFVIAASFLAHFVFATYCRFSQPESEGFQAQYSGGHMVLREVIPNSPAAEAGLAPGDRVLSVNSQPVGTDVDWLAFRVNMEINRPLQLEIEREGRELQASLTPKRRLWTNSTITSRVLPLGWSSAQSLMLILAFVIAFSKPRDPVALFGAWLLATAAIFPLDVPRGRFAVWRQLPTSLGILLWIPYFSALVPGAIVFTFFANFPRRLFGARWGWALVWLPSLFSLAGIVSSMSRVLYQPEHLTGARLTWSFRTNTLVAAAYLVAGVIALILNYRSLEDVNARRRVRVLVLGSTIGILAVLPITVIPRTNPLFPGVPTQIAVLFLSLALPLSFAYAILHDRLFDIRVMIRQGLQYALARGVVLSVLPGLALILIIDLFVHSSQPLVAILSARGWIYSLLAGLGLLVYFRRKLWLEALDRRFFREHCDAQRLLRDVVEEVREAGSFERVSPRVVARIGAALHPEFVALMVRDPRELSYRIAACAPVGQAPPPLLAESKLISFIRLLGRPLDLSSAESGWLSQQLPHDETDFVRGARMGLLVPIAISTDRREALLVLGIKLSEEPYSQEDQDLVVAIASSLALLLERSAAAPPRVNDAFEECPQCGACYDTGVARCAQEGASLVRVFLPRLLAGRYQLNERRGRGGMGTVYEAVDTALDRRVAVKVIRDDLMGSAVAAERFRQEARVAASFTHPNVVTVYDFGVAANARAFLIMELLEGVTLREELRKQARLTASRTLEILRCVCAAVDAAHRRQLIHRDLKPENVFLARVETGESAKVLDFGLAKFVPTKSEQTLDTDPGALVGTIRYMAPEQLRGQPVDPAWDLWALTVMAYEMLTGEQPFASSAVAVERGSFIPVNQHLAEAPERWQGFFARGFALDEGQRPPTARVFISELERALS